VPKPQKHDFTLKLMRVIEPKGGPGVELATLEDAARFMGKMRPFRQRWPHWDYAAELVLVAATTGQEADIERERQRRWKEPYGVTIGCDDAARFLLAR
jgi:hypothetical protein